MNSTEFDLKCDLRIMTTASDVTLLSEADIPFNTGDTLRFQCWLYEPLKQEFIVLQAGSPKGNDVHVRVHDACLTSEVFGSCKCDCKHQLVSAQRHIGRRARRGEGGGIIVYTFQEGRNIGLANKIAAYDLQQRLGLDTVRHKTRVVGSYPSSRLVCTHRHGTYAA